MIYKFVITFTHYFGIFLGLFLLGYVHLVEHFAEAGEKPEGRHAEVHDEWLEPVEVYHECCVVFFHCVDVSGIETCRRAVRLNAFDVFALDEGIQRLEETPYYLFINLCVHIYMI